MAMSQRKILNRLAKAQERRKLVRIHRSNLVDEKMGGYVLQVTDEWVVLQELADAVFADGCEAIRVKDITSVKNESDEEYIERALRVLGRPSAEFAIPEGASTRDVIEAAASREDLIGVHSEQWEGEPLWIGRLEKTRNKSFDLLFVDTGGKWADEPDTWRYKDITRVEFGGRYFAALQQFGETPPAVTARK